MKKYLILADIVIVAALAVMCMLADRKIERLTAERDRHAGNTAALLFDVQRYRVRDSLSAARAQSLELTIREYERFRAEDAALIKEMKQRNRDLSAVNKTQSQTIIDLRAIPKDTRTPEQKKAMAELVYNLLEVYPITDILGHRDASPDKNGDGKITKNEWVKSCPCFSVRDEFPMAVCVAKKKEK